MSKARGAADPETADAEAVETPVRARRPYLRAEERRRRIIAAAQQVFARTNLQGARTRDIAKAADVNQATLFQHFESKEALFMAAVIAPLLEAMRGMEERTLAGKAATTPDEILAVAEESAGPHLQAMIDIFPLLSVSLFADPELGRKLYLEHIFPLLERRGEMLRDVVGEHIDPAFAGLALFGLRFAVAMDQAFRGGEGDADKLGRQIIDFAALGFLNERRGD